MAKSFKSDSRYVFPAMIKAWTSCDWSELHNNRQSEYHPWWKERPKDLFVLVFMSVLIHFSIQGVELWMGEMFFRRFSFFLCWYSCCCCSLSLVSNGVCLACFSSHSEKGYSPSFRELVVLFSVPKTFCFAQLFSFRNGTERLWKMVSFN